MMTRFSSSSLLVRLALGLALAGGAAAVSSQTAFAQQAQQSERVAAVVNEDAVSLRDLEMRIKLVLLSSNLPDTMEARSRVAGQVLRKLIDERLQLQEAEKQHISVSNSDISSSIANVEQQNNMPRGGMETLLKSKGIDPDTLRQQIRTEIVWSRLIRRTMQTEIKVGEEEIDTRLATIKENMGKPEYLAAEIFLPIDNPTHKAEVEALANQLIDQMNKGAPFSALARQFSQTGASSGGDLGWVSEGMLDPELMSVLVSLSPGKPSQPIMDVDGIHILLLRDQRVIGQSKREPTFDVSLVNLTTLPSATAAEREEQVQRVRTSVANVNKCEDYPKALKSVPAAEYNHIGQMTPSEIPPEVLKLIEPLSVGQMSAPLSLSDGKRFYILCGRTDPDASGLPSREEVKRRLEDEKVAVQAQRLMRDVRRAAFVEFRI